MSARSTLLPARLQSLRDARAFVEAFCADHAVPRTSMQKLVLVIEELFANAVHHGHRGDSDAPVWIELRRDQGGVSVTFEDLAPPFNPYARLPDESPDSTLERRSIGGLGVLLTREINSMRDYAYLHGRNCIRLRIGC